MIRNWTAILFTACTQDELSSPTGGVEGALPDGEYPLQIGSVSITAEVSEEPWTRVAENETDGMGSIWQPDDAITVSLDGETATYTYDGSAWTSDAPLYWKNTQTAEVTAWYAKPQPTAYNWISLRDQDNGLAYVLRATADNASYDTPVSLQFEHQLAKVRVVTTGTADVDKIEIVGMPTGCSIQQGEIIGASGYDWLPMRRTTYQDGTEYWEANVVPGKEIQAFNVSGTNGVSRSCDISPYITPEAGNVHTVMLTVNSAGTQSIRLSTDSIGNNGTEQSQ